MGEPNFGRGGNLLFQNFRTSNEGPQNSVSSNHASTRSSPQSRLMMPMTAAPTRVTTTATTSNLRDFTVALQETLRCLSATDLNTCQELAAHLDALIRRATTLR